MTSNLQTENMAKRTLPPGPRGLPFIGNVASYEENRHGFILDSAREYGDVVRYDRKLFFLNNSDYIAHALRHTNAEFILDVNLLRRNVDGRSGSDDLSRWMGVRQPAVRGLTRAAVAAHVERSARLLTELLDHWRAGEIIDVVPALEGLTARYMADFCFSHEGDDVPLRAGALLDALFPIMASPFTFPKWVPRERRVRRELALFEAEISGLIAVRRRRPTESSDLLNVLLTDDEIDDEGICEILVAILLAAYGVPAAALAWILWLLSENPDVDARLRTEVSTVIGDRLPTADDLPRLAETEAVVKEALRLYPPTPLAGRRLDAPCEFGGYVLEPGHKVVWSAYVVHRDPRKFYDADRFRPERWLDAEWVAALPKLAYLPFGGGPRSCMGANLAMTELILATALITRRFQLRPVTGWECVPDMRRTLMPKDFRAQLVSVTEVKPACLDPAVR